MTRPIACVGDPFVTPLADKHPHVGGTIVGPGAPRVLVEGRPVAVAGDRAPSQGPVYVVAAGSARILVEGRPAARVGDPLLPGGTIVGGSARVTGG